MIVLDVPDIVRFQAISSRYFVLARDNAVWKLVCFQHSRAEAHHRRQRLLDAQDSRLAELRHAVSALSEHRADDRVDSDAARTANRMGESEDERRLWHRALTNWEPGYPGERIDYYDEYVQRHAEIDVDWIRLPQPEANEKETLREATGTGLLERDTGSPAQHLVAPLDDGSICIFDITSRTTLAPGGNGRLLARSKSGLLTNRDDSNESHAIMTETGAVECVSIDSRASKGYFAVQNVLREVDLGTLQLISSKTYPFSITALSSCSPTAPLAIGTNHTVHLYDSRDSQRPQSLSLTRELIAGPSRNFEYHASLSQPGPLALLHHPDSQSLWTAGRFTSLLQYDLRHFPRLLSTVHSGARVASLVSVPYPLLGQSMPRTSPGTTLIAAAAYKGKGSLELFGLNPEQGAPTVYQNRQTASATKLLSAVPHGGRIAFSDGNGAIKWVERDGSTLVRTCDINNFPAPSLSSSGSTPVSTPPRSAMFTSGDDDSAAANGTIVQKLLPLPTSLSHSNNSGRPDCPTQPLLLWTGDGELGILNFYTSSKDKDAWHDAVETQTLSTETLAHQDAERQFALTMRRALERSANEVRFVRGLGMRG